MYTIIYKYITLLQNPDFPGVLADAIILLKARAMGVKVLTCDRRSKGTKEVQMLHATRNGAAAMLFLHGFQKHKLVM